VIIQEYLFPDQDSLEHVEYRVFPPELENDDLVLFHGTLAENMDSILKDGFKSAAALGTGPLASVSFAYKSTAALTHLAGQTGDRVIFAVRYASIDRPSIKKNLSDIHDFALDPAPLIIGLCRLPSGYLHR
jgi:hypothetical protein